MLPHQSINERTWQRVFRGPKSLLRGGHPATRLAVSCFSVSVLVLTSGCLEVQVQFHKSMFSAWLLGDQLCSGELHVPNRLFTAQILRPQSSVSALVMLCLGRRWRDLPCNPSGPLAYDFAHPQQSCCQECKSFFFTLLGPLYLEAVGAIILGLSMYPMGLVRTACTPWA